MRSEQIKDEINKMGLAEKLLLVEDIWDSIAASNADISMPEWQKKELDNRYSDYKSGRLTVHDWKSVHNELREKYK